jgi:hypothetical protein
VRAAGTANCGNSENTVMTMSAMTFSAGSGGDYKRLETGSHAAVCDQVILLGLQPGSAQYPKPKLKVYIRWQVPSERTEDDRPMVIGATLTASMNEKAQLRKLLEGWRGEKFTDEAAESFDVAKLIGKACMVSVVESESGGKTYSNVASVSKLPKGMPAPVLEGEPLVYWNTRSNEDGFVFRKLPEWLQKKIDSQLEPESAPRRDEHAFAGEFNDDVPF